MDEYRGITMELIGDSGSGKSTQAGEMVKYVYKTRKKRAVLNTADRGGYDSIGALARAGVMEVNELGPEDDPWLWANNAVEGVNCGADIGLAIFDSGSSISDMLLTACAKSTFQIGQRAAQKFTVSKGERSLQVSTAADSHYNVVQQFMLDQIRRSTWLTLRGIDVLWTFVLHRSEDQGRTPILGPKIAGKALTALLPKEFRYTFRLESIPQEGEQPLHRIYLSEHPELAGLGHAFGNARYPLGATPLPAYIEPANLPAALELIERGQAEADALVKAELGL